MVRCNVKWRVGKTYLPFIHDFAIENEVTFFLMSEDTTKLFDNNITALLLSIGPISVVCELQPKAKSRHVLTGALAFSVSLHLVRYSQKASCEVILFSLGWASANVVAGFVMFFYKPHEVSHHSHPTLGVGFVTPVLYVCAA